MIPPSYHSHNAPKGKPKRVCLSRAFVIGPGGESQPVPHFPAVLRRTQSIQSLRRCLRILMPVPKPFGRLVILSFTVREDAPPSE